MIFLSKGSHLIHDLFILVNKKVVTHSRNLMTKMHHFNTKIILITAKTIVLIRLLLFLVTYI